MMTLERQQKPYTLSLSPHRSLPPRGFLVLMIFIGVVSFTAGIAFLMMGAWPVFGFFGLDVLLVYVAFRLNYREAQKREVIEIREGDLRVRAISPSGTEKCRTFQSYWSRCVIEGEMLLIRSRNETAEIGSFLNLEEKEEVMNEITSALHRDRNIISVS
ncbi:MAG: DUF2244 domain-containing protein [Pseudomonas marincola]